MGTAANELTPTDWDPASKQPIFKTAAARIARVADRDTTSCGRPTRVSTGGPT